MIGLLLIYFIGKYFYDLAGQYKKSRWGFAILGIVSYYAGTIIGGAGLGIFMDLMLDISVDELPGIALGLMTVPFGVLACWGFYKLLQSRWSKPSSSVPDDVLDQNL
jgi:hypothetical protein